jgi:hypothetical protein
MKNIRQGVFETNSSSTHSVSVSKDSDGIYDTLLPENGILTIEGEDFGWEWQTYNDPKMKAAYAAVYLNYDSSQTEILEKVLKEHTGAKEIVFNIKNNYIDHDSVDNARSLFDELTLKEFIFNPKSYLMLGNDNDTPPPNFYDDKNLKYTHVVSFGGYHEKCVGYPEGKVLEGIIERNFDRASLHRNPFATDKEYFWKITDDSFSKISENKVTLFDSYNDYCERKELSFSIKEIK